MPIAFGTKSAVLLELDFISASDTVSFSTPGVFQDSGYQKVVLLIVAAFANRYLHSALILFDCFLWNV